MKSPRFSLIVAGAVATAIVASSFAAAQTVSGESRRHQ